MNKIITSLVVFFIFLSATAQKKAVDSIISENKTTYNTWSIEVNIGFSKAVRPFTDGYASSGDSKFLNITGINHFDIGVRKMINPKFGLKFDIASDIIENQGSSADSKNFYSTQNRVALQGIINLARVLNFNTFSKRIGLLAHGGVQFGALTPKPVGSKIRTDRNGGYIIGLTPQVKITDKLVFTTDFSVLVNSRQHLTWNGGENKVSNNLSGEMNVINFGLTCYLGKNGKHADWTNLPAKHDPVLQKSIEALEKLIKDVDLDGIPDYIDLQNDTPKGLVVDSRGRFIDVNKNNIPDELEPPVETVKKPTETKTDESYNLDNIKLEFGIIDIYYDPNKISPVERSKTVLNNLILFLKKFPETKITLTGYSYATGNAKTNIELANKRAENLKKFIVSKGITADRMTTSGKGVDQFSNVNDISSLELARRVSITLK